MHLRCIHNINIVKSIQTKQVLLTKPHLGGVYLPETKFKQNLSRSIIVVNIAILSIANTVVSIAKVLQFLKIYIGIDIANIFSSIGKSNSYQYKYRYLLEHTNTRHETRARLTYMGRVCTVLAGSPYFYLKN